MIPLGVLKRRAKLTLRKPTFQSERVENVYPDHEKYLRDVGLAHPIPPTMVELWKGQYKKVY